MRKLTSVFLTLVLVMGIIAGCTKADNSAEKDVKTDTSNTPTNDSKQKDPVSTKAKTNEFGWTVPEKTLEFSFYAGQDNPDKVKENTIIINKFLLDNFNVKMNKIVYDVDQKQKLNLMLASGDYPDVITGLSEEDAQKFIDQGKVVNISQYLGSVAPNIKEKLGTLYKSYVSKDSKLYILPQNYGYLEIPDNSAHIRNDWWKEMGSPAFSTPDEYFNVLKEMQKLHSKNSKGEKTYAISGYDSVKLQKVLAGIWGLKDGYKEDASGSLTHWINTPEGLELTKYMNKYYVEGLLDPDIFINKFDDWKAKFSSERIMGAIGGWWISWNAGHEVWQKTMSNWNDEMRYVQVAIKAPEAKKAYLSPKNARGDYFTIITDKAKAPEAIMKWLNFQITDIGNRIIGWGPPNIENGLWTFDGSGSKFTEDQKKAMIAGTFDFTKGDLLGQGQYALVQGLNPMKDDGHSSFWYDQNFNQEAKWKKIMNDNMKDTIYDNTLQTIAIPPNTPEATKDQQIKDAINTGWSKAVLSKSAADSESAFMELRKKVNEMGLHDLEKYRTNIYQQHLQNWK